MTLTFYAVYTLRYIAKTAVSHKSIIQEFRFRRIVMTVLTRWDPFREFSTLQDRMNRLFRDSYGDGREEALTTSTFAPPVDVYEDEHNVVLKIEVPGMDEKDIDVRAE